MLSRQYAQQKKKRAPGPPELDGVFSVGGRLAVAGEDVELSEAVGG